MFFFVKVQYRCPWQSYITLQIFIFTFLGLTVGISHFPFLPKKRSPVTSEIWEGDIFIVREPSELQYKIGKMLFLYVRKFWDLHDCKRLKFKKLIKIGPLQIVFHFFIFLNAQNYCCSTLLRETINPFFHITFRNVPSLNFGVQEDLFLFY